MVIMVYLPVVRRTASLDTNGQASDVQTVWVSRPFGHVIYVVAPDNSATIAGDSESEIWASWHFRCEAWTLSNIEISVGR